MSDKNGKLPDLSTRDFLGLLGRVVLFIGRNGPVSSTEIATVVLGKKQYKPTIDRLLDEAMRMGVVDWESAWPQKTGVRWFLVRGEATGPREGASWIRPEGQQSVRTVFDTIDVLARDRPEENWRQVAQIRHIDEEFASALQVDAWTELFGLEIALERWLTAPKSRRELENLLGYVPPAFALIEVISATLGLRCRVRGGPIIDLVLNTNEIAEVCPPFAAFLWYSQGGFVRELRPLQSLSQQQTAEAILAEAVAAADLDAIEDD